MSSATQGFVTVKPRSVRGPTHNLAAHPDNAELDRKKKFTRGHAATSENKRLNSVSEVNLIITAFAMAICHSARGVILFRVRPPFFCTGGHRLLYSKYRKQPSRRHAKKRGGQLSVGFVNTTVFFLRFEMMQKYNVKWTSEALHFLQRALNSHRQELIDNIHEKLHELNDGPKNISNATVSVLRDYQYR